MLSPSAQSFLARIESDAGLGNIRHDFALVGDAKLDGEVGGFEIFQQILNSVKAIVRDFAPGLLTPEMIGDIRAALDAALDQAFLVIDWPYIPDAPVDFMLRKFAHAALDKAVKAILGS